ncbi:MAG: nucleotide pyrophosphohydrolase [Gammaproteobacteria bacterium]
MPNNLDITEISATLRQFASDRNWNQFHSPKNLSMALNVEAAELLEHFQWLTEQESLTLDDNKRDAVATEIADVLIYLIRISDILKIDLNDAVHSKMALNSEKYPVEKVYGSSKKYTEY